MTLHRRYRSLLIELAAAGGSATLDNAGRLCVGPTRRPLAGTPHDWLVVVTHGLIAGEDGRILMTEAGREYVAGAEHGTVRESRG